MTIVIAVSKNSKSKYRSILCEENVLSIILLSDENMAVALLVVDHVTVLAGTRWVGR